MKIAVLNYFGGVATQKREGYRELPGKMRDPWRCMSLIPLRFGLNSRIVMCMTYNSVLVIPYR